MQLLPRLAFRSAALLLLVPLATGAQENVWPRPAPPGGGPLPLALYSAEPRTGEAPLTVRFYDHSVGPITSWRWEFGDGATSRLRNPVHIYTEKGIYPVSLTVKGPLGEDRVRHPMGVVVRDSWPDSARTNRSYPLELGEEFIPVTGDDSLGFWCVYSGKAQDDGTGLDNNVGIFVLPLAGGEVLIFGAGYGDENSMVIPTESARHDADRVDTVIRSYLGGSPAGSPIRFVTPHGHIDHVNADFMHELRRLGYRIKEIVYHASDSGGVRWLPGWTSEDRALFRSVYGRTGECQEELLSYASPLGKIWFYLREGHTAGSIDLALDVRSDPTNRFLVRGSGGSYGACPIPGVREAIEPHGNIQFRADPPRVEAVDPATASAVGGTELLLSGSAFAKGDGGLPQVFIGHALAASVRIVNDGNLTCIAPPGIPGSKAEVVVLNRNGMTEFAGKLAYRALPTLVSVTPASGPSSGGILVTLRGSGFEQDAPGTNSVHFGGVAASDVQVESDMLLRCTLPPHAPGTVEVTLGNSNGAALLAGAFRFDPPIDVIYVTDLVPARGSPLGGTRVEIHGSGFAHGASVPQVTFGGVPALEVVRVSDTRIDCRAPAGASGAQVDVRVAGENGEDSLAGGFHYYFSPELHSVTPQHGSQRGGTEVTLAGLRFTRNAAGTNVVEFGGLPATGVQVDSDAVLRCQVPPGVAGALVDVRVSNANGGATLAQGFRYHRAPLVTSVEPSFGPSAGGTLVTLRGSGFDEDAPGPNTVRFGGVAASDVQVESDTLLRCTLPPHAPGTVEVTLANGNGAATLAGAFRFDAPIDLTELVPARGSPLGGTPVEIHGAGFAYGASVPQVTFGGVRSLDVVRVSDTRIDCRAPAGVGGAQVDVRVAAEHGEDSLAGGFHYFLSPEVHSLTPQHGPQSGGTEVTLTGLRFTRNAAGTNVVEFGGIPATGVQADSDAGLRCQVPPGVAGTQVDVRVSNANGGSTLPQGFRYHSAPVVTSVEPSFGPRAGGTLVTLRGSGFLTEVNGATEVRLGARTALDVTVLDDATLTCRTRPGASGAVDVALLNSNGEVRLAGAFRYVIPPRLASVEPDEGPSSPGTLATLRGSGFLAVGAGVPEVEFSGVAAEGVRVVDDGTLTCLTPLGRPGTRTDVRLVNRHGEASLPASYRFLPLPELDSVYPASGPESGGTRVTLSGSGFLALGPPHVRFGALAALDVVVLTDELLECTTPASAAGAVSVHLATGAGAVTQAEAFVFASTGPTLRSLSPEHGSSLGGTEVHLVGQGFRAASAGSNAVFFGSLPATGVVAPSDTELRCLVPAGEPGSRVDVRVTNALGSSVLAAGHRYHLQPSLAGVSPALGGALGGATVTLTGAGFQRDDARDPRVRFGTALASDVVVLADGTLTCTLPPGTSGQSVDVEFSCSNGSARLAAGFRYRSVPVLTRVSPASGPSLGGTTVTLDGAGLADSDLTVTFGGVPALDVRVLDATRATCRTPAGPVGSSVEVRVENADGSAALPAAFTYRIGPTLQAIAPESGPAAGGVLVVLAGSGFLADAAGPPSVTFGDVPAQSVVLVDDARLHAVTPAGDPGESVDVRVSNSNGEATLAQAFHYLVAPTVGAVVPAYGFSGGGTLVEVGGSGYLADGAGPARIFFGGLPATDVVVLDDARLRCRTPASSAGPVQLRVPVLIENHNGSAVLPDAFAYDWAPTLTGIEPGAGSSLGGSEVRLTGGGFASAGAGPLAVRFGVRQATNVRVVDGGTVLCTSPLGLAGERVTVRVSSARGGSSLVGFAYHPRPRITSVEPAQGSPAGGTLVTLRGSGFLANSAGVPRVLFDAGAASAVTVLDDATLLCRTPPGPARVSATVSLENANGLHALAQAFRWLERHPADLDDDGLCDALLAGEEAVYLVLGSLFGLGEKSTSAADLVLRPDKLGGDFGAQLASGDLDGDEIPDLAVSAPRDDRSGRYAGAVYVFAGPLEPSSNARLSSSADAVFLGPVGSRFGTGLGIRDVTGDGQPDLVVGAPDEASSGAVYVYRGGPGFTELSTSQAAVRLTAYHDRTTFGESIALGDVTGDGLADVIASAPREDSDEGAVYVFRGGPTLATARTPQAQVKLTGAGSNDRLGSIARVGDFDGDGFEDLFVGAPEARVGGVRSGAVYAFQGGPLLSSREATAADAIWTGEASDDYFGQSLALGDADADGRADLLVGAPLADATAYNSGRAYLVRGGAFSGGMISARAHSLLWGENSSGDRFGTALALLDLDGDGRDDLLVGSPFSNGGGSDSGRLHGFAGAALQATRFASADEWTLTGAGSDVKLGLSLNESH